jgi:hypothetical protein
MFEKAVIRRAEERDVDIGLIAETVLFYGKTQLLLNRAVIDTLTKIPRDDLIALASRGCLNFSYVKPTFAVISKGLIRTHSLRRSKLPRKADREYERLKRKFWVHSRKPMATPAQLEGRLLNLLIG